MKKTSLLCLALIGIGPPVNAEPSLNLNASDNQRSEIPTFQNGHLIIPRIDTPERIGKYFDATFSPTQSGHWQLDSFQEAEKNYRLAPVKTVELVSVEGQPKQIFLRLKGEFGGCGNLGRIDTQLDQQTFKVMVNDGFDQATAPVVLCTAQIRPFEKAIPLPVFELKAGTYHYSVNNQFNGSFTLSSDNTLLTQTPAICTMDAKLCPDGSFVGRTGPNCEFASCPGQ